jgi:hypothetical protein
VSALMRQAVVTQGRPRLRERLNTLVPGITGPSPAFEPGWGYDLDDAVHRAIVVVDIAESTAPIRRNSDRVLMRQAMYRSLTGAFRRRDWQKCYHEDRGDGVLLLVHPRVPKGWLVTVLPDKIEAALIEHNAMVAEQYPGRAAAAQVRLRVAVSAGEVTFDEHGVVGQAIDETFRLAEAEPLKNAFAPSPDVCALIVSDWFFRDVVFQHADARPDSYQHIDCRVKQTSLSAWMRTPVPTLARKEQVHQGPPITLRETA